jgi:N-acetylneuraminic acid mutarotase
VLVVGGKTGDGTNGGTAVKSLFIYDPTSDTWVTGPEKPLGATALEDQAVVAANGHLYVIGGATGAFSNFKSEVWVYTPAGDDLNEGEWNEGPSLPDALSGATAVVHEGDIWVIGGMDGTTAGGASRDEVFILSGLDPNDPTAGSWNPGPSLVQVRDNAGAAVLDGRIHVFGGRERDGTTIVGNLDTYEVLQEGAWTLVDPAGEFTGRRSFVVGMLNGDAQIMGGEDEFVEANENFDAQTGVWTTLAPLVPARHGAAYATIGNTVYIVGGSIDGENQTTLNESFTLP